jgi:hypothetical protein
MFLFLRTLFLRHILWTKRDLNSADHLIKVLVTLLYLFYLHVHIRIKILFIVVTAKLYSNSKQLYCLLAAQK